MSHKFLAVVAAIFALTLLAEPAASARFFGGGNHAATHRSHVAARPMTFGRVSNRTRVTSVKRSRASTMRRESTVRRETSIRREATKTGRHPTGRAVSNCLRERSCGPKKPPGDTTQCRGDRCRPHPPKPTGTGTVVGLPTGPSLPTGTGTVSTGTPIGVASTQSSSSPSSSSGNTAPPGGGAPAIRAGFDVPPANEQRYRQHEVLLDVPDSASAPSLDSIARRHRLTRLESYRVRLTGRTLHRLHIDDGRAVPDVIRTLAGDTRIVAAQPNYLFSLQDAVRPAAPPPPNGDLQYVVAKLHLTEAHQMATGERVLVAIIDTGIDGSHPYLAGSIAETFNAVGGENSPNQHGTAMAGAIADHGDLTGVAPGARLLAVRAFAPGVSSEATSLGIIKGLDWAVGRGARVINMSFAGPRDPGIEAPIAAAHRKNVVLIAAAGNDGPRGSARYPAADPHVIAVTATDPDDKLFAHANRGSYIAVSAPGVDVMAPILESGVEAVTGTSIAAAHVSGVAALLIERNPKLRPEDIRRILKATAVKPTPNASAEEFGAGVVDALAAIRTIETTGATVSDSSSTVRR